MVKSMLVLPCMAWVALFAAPAVSPAEGTAPRKITCFGDSITAGAYPSVLATLMPDAEIRSAGIGGNTTGQGLARMEADVLAGAPDVVVVLFGTNDSVLRAPKAYRTPLDQYKKNLEKIVLACREKGAEPILCTLPPIVAEPYYTRHPKAFYEPEGGLAAIVGRYRDAAVAVAKAHDVTLVDLNQQLIPEKHLKPDGVHPNKEGEAAIARLVAKAVEQVVAARVAAE